MSGETELKKRAEDFAASDPYLPTIMKDRVEAVVDGKISFSSERPHASSKSFGMRTFTQIGPVGRAILVAVHDRVHGIDRSEDYELDKKKGVLVLKRDR